MLCTCTCSAFEVSCLCIILIYIDTDIEVLRVLVALYLHVHCVFLGVDILSVFSDEALCCQRSSAKHARCTCDKSISRRLQTSQCLTDRKTAENAGQVATIDYSFVHLFITSKQHMQYLLLYM